MKKRFISLLLSLAMTMTMVAMPVAGAEIVPSESFTEAVIEEIAITDETEITDDVVIETDDASVEVVSVEELDEENAAATESIAEATEDTSIESGYVLTDDQKADKALLFANLNKTFGIDESISAEEIIKADSIAMSSADGVSHAKGEVIYLTDSKEDAEKVANLYGGKLDSYAYKVAVIKLPETLSTFEAVCMSADPDTNLPMVTPNSVKTLFDVSTSATKLDPYLKKSVGNLKYQWNIDYVGARQAWAKGYKGQGVRVAVIDSGVTRSHIDLKKNTTTGYTFYRGANGKKKNTGYFDHGTHVAGIICADDNGKLGAGVAPDSKVTSYAIFGKDKKTYQSDNLRAINAIIEKGVFHIINMSYGGYEYDVNEFKVLTDAKNHGIACFAAAGNEATSDLSYPASYDNAVMSIASIDWQGYISYFSNYGSSVDMCFPGSAIYSCKWDNDSKYLYMSGTSQATPMAAGVAAVILSSRPDLMNSRSASSVDTLFSIMKSNVIKERNNNGKYIGVGTTYLPKVFGGFVPISSVRFEVPEKVKRGKSFKVTAIVTPENVTTNGIIYANGKATSKYFTIKGSKISVSSKTPAGEYTIYAFSDDHSIYAEPITINIVK